MTRLSIVSDTQQIDYYRTINIENLQVQYYNIENDVVILRPKTSSSLLRHCEISYRNTY